MKPGTSIGQQRSIELTAGHPLAVARLRAMQRVIEAAAKVFPDGSGALAELAALKVALKDGGWIE